MRRSRVTIPLDSSLQSRPGGRHTPLLTKPLAEPDPSLFSEGRCWATPELWCLGRPCTDLTDVPGKLEVTVVLSPIIPLSLRVVFAQQQRRTWTTFLSAQKHSFLPLVQLSWL